MNNLPIANRKLRSMPRALTAGYAALGLESDGGVLDRFMKRDRTLWQTLHA